MATVKGDVHDIGKNIVGVVLGCNNYEVIDLGVMVPAAKILDAAIEQKADIIGLSGLITPSLDEMVFVAREMTRRGFTMPLLIGGATTSKQHTAVKIAPEYSGPVVHVLDASRAVDVVSSLLGERTADVRDGEPRGAGGASRAVRHPAREAAAHVREGARQPAADRLGRARDRARRGSSAAATSRCRSQDLVPYIDWTFFFSAWELKGGFPAILEHPEYGAAARELYEHAQDAARRDHRREAADGARRLRLLAGQQPTATTSSSTRTTRRRERAGAVPDAAAAGDHRRRRSRIGRSPTSSRRGRAACPTTSACSR